MIGFVDVDIEEDGVEVPCLVLSHFQIREYEDGRRVLVLELNDEMMEAILERMPSYAETELEDDEPEDKPPSEPN